MLARSLKLLGYDYGASALLFRSSLPLSGSISLSLRHLRAFQQCSAINQDLESQTSSAQIPDTHTSSQGKLRIIRQIIPRASRSTKSPKIRKVSVKDTPAKTRGHGWTIIAREGQLQLLLEEALKSIPFSKLLPYNNPLLVVLISAQAAAIEKDLETIASRIASKLYAPPLDSKFSLQILSAIVDKVSIPAGVAGLMSSDELASGAHGCSFWWTRRSKLEIRPVELDLHGETQMQGSLIIHITESQPKYSKYASTLSRVRIPLTNTTFITGSDYKMRLQEMTWKDTEKPKDAGMDCDSYTVRNLQDLGHRTIKLAIKNDKGALKSQAHSYKNSSELTPWRSVIDVTGNVIKTVNGPVDALPASAELETAIARLDASEHGLFEIWAEIRFKKDDVNDQHVAGPSRYVKVISGGGGWGKNRGLIALDPGFVVNNWSRVQRDSLEELDFTKLLPNILEPGDEIRFVKFFTDRVDHKNTIRDTSAAILSRVAPWKDGQITFAFGTTGNPELETLATVSEEPHPTTNPSQELHTPDSDSDSLPCQTISGHFGAMTQHMYYAYKHTPRTRVQDQLYPIHATNLPPFTYISDSDQSNTLHKTFSFGSKKKVSQSPKDSPTIRRVFSLIFSKNIKDLVGTQRDIDDTGKRIRKFISNLSG